MHEENDIVTTSHTVPAWFEERLSEPGLLDQAVSWNGALAVPVGNQRRSGFICVLDRHDGDKLVEHLSGSQGFPSPRIVASQCEDSAHNVLWGEPEPT